MCIISLTGCGKNSELETETLSQDYFNSVVLEIADDVILAECTECESGAISIGSQVSVDMDTVSLEEVPLLAVGDKIRVVYIGEVMESNPLKLQEVISIFWVDENGEVVTEGAKITEIKHEPTEKPDWGIRLNVENVTPTGITIVCSQSNVDVNEELSTGSYYSLSKYEDVEKDYGRIRKVFGTDRVDSLVKEMKERERMEVEAEKERRKMLRRKQRDAR